MIDRERSSVTCSVGVVGAGLGGIAAAIAITRAGHHVTVFEQAKALTEIGAGIQIPINATRILKKWGILEDLTKLPGASAVRAANTSFRSYRDGDILYSQEMAPTEEIYGSPFLTVHRSDYLAVLVQYALELGVSVELGRTVSNVSFEETTLIFTDGVHQAFDAIICADGLKSCCRALFALQPSPSVPSGHLAFRVTVPIASMFEYPELQKLALEPDVNYWLGPNSHAVTYQLKKGQLFNLVFLKADDLPEGVFNSSSLPDELQMHLEGWDPRLSQLFSLSTVESLKWKICTSPTLDTWVNGRVAIMGDAAHASLPCLGQGAASALEDAAVLGALFAKLTDKNQIPDLLQTYASIRMPRATRMVDVAAKQRDFDHLVDGLHQEARDAELRAGNPQPGWKNAMCDPEFQAWMLGEEVLEEVANLQLGVALGGLSMEST